MIVTLHLTVHHKWLVMHETVMILSWFPLKRIFYSFLISSPIFHFSRKSIHFYSISAYVSLCRHCLIIISDALLLHGRGIAPQNHPPEEATTVTLHDLTEGRSFMLRDYNKNIISNSSWSHHQAKCYKMTALENKTQRKKYTNESTFQPH